MRFDPGFPEVNRTFEFLLAHGIDGTQRTLSSNSRQIDLMLILIEKIICQLT